MRFVCVFIDWENLEKTIKQSFGHILVFEPFATFIQRKAKEIGRLGEIVAYGDFDRGEEGIQTKLMLLGIQPRHVITKTPHEYIKGALDIEMSLDIQQYMYTYPHLTDFLVVSGDQDMRYIIRRLKLNGKMVHLMAFKEKTSSRLLHLVDEFIDLGECPDMMRPMTAEEKAKRAAGLLQNQWIHKVIEKLDYYERNKKTLDFIGLNYFRTLLISRYPEAKISDALTLCLDYGLIDTYWVENIRDPENPTRACKVNRESPLVTEILKGND
jgi:uncharacterized LabA/DUF88 family protein